MICCTQKAKETNDLVCDPSCSLTCFIPVPALPRSYGHVGNHPFRLARAARTCVAPKTDWPKAGVDAAPKAGVCPKAGAEACPNGAGDGAPNPARKKKKKRKKT